MFSKELKWEGWVSCDHFWLNHVTDKNWAHQSDSAFLFGGNPGNEDHQDDRLDDFWQLCLNDESRNKILEQCKIHLLKCKFYDLKTSRPTDAIAFLRSKEVSISWLCIIKFLINEKNFRCTWTSSLISQFLLLPKILLDNFNDCFLNFYHFLGWNSSTRGASFFIEYDFRQIKRWYQSWKNESFWFYYSGLVIFHQNLFWK